MMFRKTLLTLSVTLALAAPAVADTYTVDKAHSEAAFQVRHLLTKVRGQFADFDGIQEAQKSEVPNTSTPTEQHQVALHTRHPSRKVEMNLSYTINLNLPATSDISVFNAIFRSLKEHLLKESDE